MNKKEGASCITNTPPSVSTFTKSNLFLFCHTKKSKNFIIAVMIPIASRTNLFVLVYVHRENAVYNRKLLEPLLKETNNKIIH